MNQWTNETLMTRAGTFKGVHGAELYYHVFEPSVTPKAAAIVVHGLGDHCGGLENLNHTLARNNFVAYALDLRGHGKSSGTRGFIRTWEEYRGDLHEFRKIVTSKIRGLPLFIVAHSLGGVIALDYFLYHGQGIAGLVAISPAISYEVKLSEKILITLMGKLKPDYAVEQKSDTRLLTHDLDMITKLDADILRHNTVTPGLGRGLMQTLPRIMNQAQSIDIPFLLQYGNDDKITPPGKLGDFFNSVGSKQKQKYEYTDTRHRPFDDIHREQFFIDLLSWLNEQVELNEGNSIVE